MKCVDLFAGCGGMSLGFQNCGFEILAAIDNWEAAAEVYRRNFAHNCYQQDLTDESACLEILNRYQPEMILGGPPCQDFSSAGKRDESLGRADLTTHFSNLICEYQPAWFVMENVERIKKSHILHEMTEQLIQSGYGLTAVILNAAYCHVPQARKRFFLIGQRGGLHNSLQGIYQTRLATEPMTVRDYLGDSLELEYYYRHPRNYSRRGVYSIDEPSPTVRGVNRPVPAGYPKHSADPEGAVLEEIRPLTTLERSYLQTFPMGFEFSGSKTNLEQMIGNAVPVNLAEFVARGILEFLENGQSHLQSQGLLFETEAEFQIPESSLHRL